MRFRPLSKPVADPWNEIGGKRGDAKLRHLFAIAAVATGLACLVGPALSQQPADAPPYPIPLDVRLFGVVADGTTDNQANFQKAVNAAIAAHRPLSLPPGVIFINFTASYGSAGAMIYVPGDLTIVGAGANASKIKTSDSPSAGHGYELFRIADNAHVTFQDIELAGPDKIDITTNPDYGTNSGSAKAWTWAIHILDCTNDGSLTLSRVTISGKFCSAIGLDAGAGFGHYDMVIRDSRLSAYSGTIGFFGPFNRPCPQPYAADRNLYIDRTIFVESGIPPEENGGVQNGHAVYLHPDLNTRISRCVFEKVRRYAIHFHSGGGKTVAPRFQTITDTTFSKDVREGLLLSETGTTSLIACQYYGSGNILCYVGARFSDCDFDPISPTFNMGCGYGGKPNVQAVNNRFGRNFRSIVGDGVWVYTACNSFQGGPFNDTPTGPFAARPAADATGISQGDLYWATDQGLLYQVGQSAGMAVWSPVLTGNIPIQNAGATIIVNGGNWRGAPGPTAINGAIRHTAGRTVVRASLFTGRYGNGYPPGAIAVMPNATGSLAVDGCTFMLSAGLPIQTPANMAAGTLQATNNIGAN